MTTTEPSRRRPSWLAPLVVGLAALPVGAALAVGIVNQGEASSSEDLSTTSISDTAIPDTAIPDIVPPVATTTLPPGADSLDTQPAVTDRPANEAAAAPLAPGSIRVDGETFIETFQCIAFPVSNPVTGTGDAGIRIALHQMQSAAGERLALERWRYDVGGALGVNELGKGAASTATELLEFSVEPSDAVYLVPNREGVRRVELGELAEPSTMCSTLVVDSGAEFRSAGLVDSCLVPDGSATDLAEVFTFHDGVTLTRRTAPDSGRFAGELRHPDGTFTVADGLVRSTGRGTIEFSGSLTPGPLSAADALTFELDSAPPARSCLPEQIAAFDAS